jgi:hypothetical protein
VGIEQIGLKKGSSLTHAILKHELRLKLKGAPIKQNMAASELNGFFFTEGRESLLTLFA